MVNTNEGFDKQATGGYPLVSIIVPVFNADNYLESCLDSLLNQSFSNIEIICVDDGSADTSAEILKKYVANDRRVIFLQQQRKGPGAARNLALDNAHGKYLLFVDADDSLEPKAADECSSIMENTYCDMVVFNTNIIEDTRSVPGLKNSSGEYITLVNSQNEGAMNKTETFKMMLIATVWGKMFRADLIKRYHLRFSQHMVGEDARFLISYLLIVKSAFALNKTFYNYYLRPKVLFHAKHPWLGRIFRFPGIFFDVFKFALKNAIPFRIYYFFLWLFVFFNSRKNKA
jgi:glycosyltransferase involved in cell wall biosynthesis